MKDVYVILAFHAHEPLWELPQILLESVEDMDLKLSVPGENWIVRRSAEGRDMYTALLNFAREMGITVTLEATNELLVQLAAVVPDTYAELKSAYGTGMVYPLYGHAHHTHVSLLTNEEIEDEVRLNREYIHDVMGAPRPRYAGLFPIEDSIDSSKLQGIKNSGIDFVIFPTPDRRKARYYAGAGLDERHEPFLIGPDIIALPRHFPVSQYIWRPITKWKVEGVKNQGYILGRYWVLPEEYRRRRTVRFPIGREQAVAEYVRVLRRALREAPDGGLILYIQDLELMDFGDAALDVMEASWKRVLGEDLVRVHFVTPDEYLGKRVMPNLGRLKRLRFHQMSWAPEVRLVLRYDGHYPPLEAGRFRGVDAARDIFRRWPFIFWEPGRYLVGIVNSLMDIFGVGHRVGLTAGRLQETGYRFDELDAEDRLALHSRIIKRACNWGWFPNEGLQKRPFLHAYMMADILLKRLENGAALVKGAPAPPPACFRGLERLLEVVLDTRYGFLSEAIVELAAQSGQEYRDAYRELRLALQWRDEAKQSILRARFHAQQIAASEDESREGPLRGLLSGLRDYCRAVFVSLDRLQRVWGYSGNVDFVLLKMYDYLYELYPPRFPAILESTLTEDELRQARHPVLR
ncbi:MAG: glycoside hydrolase [Chloroflexi bacterium]|nr:glycoside hydrolase [Chloroflexota bacterium]